MTRPAHGDIRVALLGCGRIARWFHLPVLAGMPGVRLVAVADPDPTAVGPATDAAPGAAVLRSWQDAVAADVDAVVIALPTPTHAAAARAAFEAGRAVYVEKPLAVDVEEARDIEAAWRRAGTVGHTGFAFRYAPRVRALADALAAGRAGRVVAVRTTVSSSPRTLPAWKARRATGGGALLDLAIHHVDLVATVLGEVAEVSATLRSVRSEDDVALLRLTLADGLPVEIAASACSRQSDTVTVLGDEATLVVDRFGPPGVQVQPAATPTSRRERLAAAVAMARDVPGRLRAVAAPAPETSFADALADVVAAVRERRDGVPARRDDGTAAAPAAGVGPAPVGGRPDIAAGVAALRVVAAAEESARTGRTVPVAR